MHSDKLFISRPTLWRSTLIIILQSVSIRVVTCLYLEIHNQWKVRRRMTILESFAYVLK